jgi:outer membrane protein OmpA-like peptidoglycan-associated protein
VAPASVDRVLSNSGSPLEAGLQQDMSQRFGHDFSRVRVHTGDEAARSAQDVSASAYTVGHNVVFNAGQFAPQTNEGQRLIAHELTHVIQQSGAGVNHLTKNEIPNPAPVSYSNNSSSDLLLQRQSIGSARGVDEKGSMLWESFRQSINLDNFDSDKATLKPDHLSQIKNYKERFQLLLGRYPDSFISVIGHTDATDTEGHNNILGQERADSVKSELTSGDSALPVAIVHAGSLGKSNLAVETKGREARNRRVQIIPQLRNFSKLAVPEPSKPLPSLSVGPENSKPPSIGSGSLLPDSKKQIPDLKLPQQTWVQDALKKDPIVKSLPKWAQDKIIDAAKDGDEMLVEKIIDSLPLGDKKAAIQSIVKSILQMVKGKKFEVPIPPLHEIPPSVAPDFPKAPGEKILNLPPIKF